MGSSNKTKGANLKGAAKAEAKNGDQAVSITESKTAAPASVVMEGGSTALPASPKAVKSIKAVKAELPAKAVKEKVKKPKLVRDSFAMPEAEYEVLRDLKKACMKAGIDIKKSELLRVGVALLKKQTPEEIQAALSDLVTLKAGRPKKEQESASQTAPSEIQGA